MKKLFLSLVTAIVAATATYAQSSMLATLSHEGQISTFYGASALREAYNAAAHGDIITLSGGSFVSVDIKKALTIRGAGMEVNTALQIEPTVIIGNVNINIPEGTEQRLTIEGIYSNHYFTYSGTLKNATLIKCRFLTFDYSGADYHLKNATFIHCRIAGEICLGNESSVSCVNCVVRDAYTYNSSTSNFEFVNCLIENNDLGRIMSSTYKNCIIATNSSNKITSGCMAYNCVGIGNSSIFNSIPNQSNNIKEYTEVFKTITSYTYNDSETFELTDEAKETFLGIDGTQVGIYGGNMPFNSTPTNPQITKCNVAAKSTADGKLSVDITVNGAK